MLLNGGQGNAGQRNEATENSLAQHSLAHTELAKKLGQQNVGNRFLSPAAIAVARASTLGTVYCVLSAVFYTLMGICQRQLSKDCDPVWVNCVQASVSAVVFGVYLAVRSIRGRSAWPPLSVAAGLMAVGVVTQLGGASYVWSLGVIGLAIGNPLQMGVMLAAAALLGWLLLGVTVEAVPQR